MVFFSSSFLGFSYSFLIVFFSFLIVFFSGLGATHDLDSRIARWGRADLDRSEPFARSRGGPQLHKQSI